MGYKNDCLNCRRVDNQGTGYTAFNTGVFLVNQKFRPPKTTDDKSWAVAALLISNGFTYYTIRDEHGMPVAYPTTIDDAQRFVNMYRTHATERKTRRKHEIEKEISELESRPPNEQRAIVIRQLKQELSNHLLHL